MTEKIRSLAIRLEKSKVIFKLAPENLSNEISDSNNKVIFTQTNDPNNKSKPQFRKIVLIVIKNFKFQMFSNEAKRGTRNRISFYQSQPPAILFNHNFKA